MVWDERRPLDPVGKTFDDACACAWNPDANGRRHRRSTMRPRDRLASLVANVGFGPSRDGPRRV